jgi:3-deoxy-D-arabino-heptulosonate 7-phosphate (DAHP) synthase
MEVSTSTNKIDLPAGVAVGAGRQTSQSNEQGQIVSGLAFPITTKNGTTTTIFIADSELADTAKVKAKITARVNAIEAITG